MNNKKIAVAFTGPSNSGKTTLIVKISEILQIEGYKVSIIKHDPKDKAKFDQEGKDSFKFSNTGANVAVVSPNKTTIFKKQTSSLEDLISLLGEFDFLLVEGLKTIPLPRICIQRENLNTDYFDVSDSIAIDDSIDTNTVPENMNILDLNKPEDIIKWIKKNGKQL
ncbi:MAG: molybdopterin-guanine dinucleotide biosynthesis protein B [Campylobacterota bacterium]|nr:molybdopterin-guanine dinucleotide biosynthesis protein B [Campylobacterota bacterium]